MLKRMELQFAEAAEKAKQSFASNDISETSVEIEDLSTDGDVEEVELEKEEVEGELMMKLSCSNVKAASFGRSEIVTFSTKENE